MKISERGLELIKSFEGCRLTAYKCPADVWTIGWGHTGGVKEGQTITTEQADQMLREDMTAYEKQVDKYRGEYAWNQNEFDALVSFSYNVGSIDQLTAYGTRSRAVIADKLLAYNRGGGKVLEGLTRRRRAERELFLEPVQDGKAEGWQQDGKGWWYRFKGGNYAKGGWYWLTEQTGGTSGWYLFSPDGYMLTGYQKDAAGDRYFLCPDEGKDEGKCMVTDARGVLMVAGIYDFENRKYVYGP